jgi:hypothetical protein
MACNPDPFSRPSPQDPFPDRCGSAPFVEALTQDLLRSEGMGACTDTSMHAPPCTADPTQPWPATAPPGIPCPPKRRSRCRVPSLTTTFPQAHWSSPWSRSRRSSTRPRSRLWRSAEDDPVWMQSEVRRCLFSSLPVSQTFQVTPYLRRAILVGSAKHSDTSKHSHGIGGPGICSKTDAPSIRLQGPQGCCAEGGSLVEGGDLHGRRYQ